MNSVESIKQSGFYLKWEHTPSKPTLSSDGYHAMRGWQVKAFKTLKSSSHMILNAPMGSGKSWMMCLLSAYKMKRDVSLKCIIAVPQTIIAPGFTDAKLQLPDGECFHWKTQHNLCIKDFSKGTVNYILDWLEYKHTSLNERVLLCTHATLVRAYNKLKAEGRLNLLQKLLIWIDEAHHVKNIEMKDLEGEAISNGIGELVAFLLSSKQEGVQIGLTTASFFRGDRYSLLTQTMEAQFNRFNLPYDEYLQTMEHLQSFSFDFLLCGHDYTKVIGTIIQLRKAKDIIYVPHPQSRHSTGDKYNEVKLLIEEYNKNFCGEIVDAQDGLTLLKKAGDTFKILDLVDEDRRLEKKAFLNNEKLKEQQDALDAIITLGMFKEGANWVWADRSIIIGARESLVDIIQMVGRLFRDVKDKKHVEVIQLLPFSLDYQKENFRENLNNYLKAIYASLILEDILRPVKICTPKTKEEQSDTKTDTRTQSGSKLLSELVPDESTRLTLIDDVVRHLARISQTNKVEGKEISDLYNEYQKTVPNILEQYAIDTNIKEIGDQIWSLLLRQSLKIKGIDVSNIAIEIISETHPLEGILRYTSNACGIDTFQKLRDAIRTSKEEERARWELNFCLLEKFIADNGHSLVPAKYTIDDNKLGVWVTSLRVRYKNNKLDSRQIERLNQIGFSWAPLEEDWNKQYGYLLEFRRMYLDRWPGQEEQFPSGNTLGKWCAWKRSNKDNLPNWQVEKLNSIHFPWNFHDKFFESQFINLLEFRKRNPNRWPKYKEEFPEGIKLGIWCDSLRQRYKLDKSGTRKLQQLQIDQLNEIGFPWNLTDYYWTEQFTTLLEFRKINPNRWPKDKEKYPDQNQLGIWCGTQKSSYKKGSLEKWQVAKLNEINFPLEHNRKSQEINNWHRQYACLLEFRNSYPNRWPKNEENYPEHNKLGYWCKNQKRRKEKLMDWQIDKLDKISFPWLSKSRVKIEEQA